MSAHPPHQPYHPYHPPPGAPGYGPYYGYGPPAPVQPLPPTGGGRPGVVGAIGVTSVVVAVLSLMASFGSAMYGLTMFQVARTTTAAARASAARAAVAPAPPPPTTKPRSAPVTWARGMTPADRQTVAEVLEQLESLSPEKLSQLDVILTRAGKEIFPGLKEPVKDGLEVVGAVRDHGNLPSADANDPDPVYFDTAAGQLVLYSDRAVFKPNNPGAAKIRTAAGTESELGEEKPPAPTAPGPPATPPAGGVPAPKPPADPKAPVDPFASEDDPFAPDPPAAGGSAGGVSSAPAAAPGGPPAPLTGSSLTPAQVQSVVQKAQAASGNKLNPAQLATLTTALQAPGQTLVPPGGFWSPVSLAQVQPDGTAILKLSGGYLVMDPQGQITDQGSTGMPAITIHPLAVSMVIGEAVVSFALAVYLFVVGILVIRQSPRGGRLHLVYALIKIPLAVLAGVGFAWVGSELTSSIPGASAAAATFVTIGIVLAVAGLIYPVALLIALRTRPVREYFANAA